MQNKRGQVTIFIIIAIVLVAIIAMFFALRAGILSDVFTASPKNPEAFLQTCLEDSVIEGINYLGPKAGNPNPTRHFAFTFEEEEVPYEITYLCYTEAATETCTNLNANLLSDVEQELYNYLAEQNPAESDYVQDCFNALESSYSKDGYDVAVKQGDFNVELTQGRIIINSDREIMLSKAGETNVEKNFKLEFKSSFYDLFFIAHEIVNGEATSCSFNYFDIINKYPEFNIQKEDLENGVWIYTIKDKISQEWIRFGVKGCITE